ncbi:MAG: BatD family protein [Kangiellaceae bacterium]|nr:BatD family protein [Kangiellaceae bacterium]
MKSNLIFTSVNPNIFLRFLIIFGLSFFSANSFAKITQSIDRTNIHAGESFLLTLQVDEDTGAEPDLSLIPKAFTIVSNSQYQNMSFINGVSSVTKGWKIKLSTLKTGKMVIPSITIGKHKSKAIELFIKDTSDRIDIAGQKKAIYLETSVDLKEVYVQQQIIFVVRLYRAINTHYARLTEPTAGDSIIEKLGDDVQFDKNIDNTRYVVTERRYAIFPQQSGKLEIDSVNFTADINDSSSRSNRRFLSTTRPISVNSKSIDITVLPQPANTAQPWMPASDVVLADKWSNGNQQLTVGEPVTWTILLYAQGLSESQLPEVKIPKVDGLQFYPDTAQKERQINDQGILGQRIEKIAVIPSKVGTVTIPEVKVKWWDSSAKKEKTATLTAKTFTVIAGASSTSVTSEAEKIGPASETITIVDNTQVVYWKSATIALLLVWLFTLLLYVRNRNSTAQKHLARNISRKTHANRLEQSETRSALQSKLSLAIKKGSASEIENQLLNWASTISVENYRSLGQLANQIDDKQISTKIKTLDSNRYAKNSQDYSCDLDNSDLKSIEQLLKNTNQDKKSNAIPPLYPR